MMDSIKDFIDNTFGYLTDPEGLGFPILIGTGLGMILYLMHATGKSQKISDDSIEGKKGEQSRRNIPFKPL